MNHFIIGQYNIFDEDKHKRDFKEGFWGVEASLFKSEEEVKNLIAHKKRDDFKVGVHFPLRTGMWAHRDPQYLSNDDFVRKESYDYMTKELERCKAVDPEYILMHYPKPVLLDERVDWEGRQWRFYHSSEYFYESECDLNTFISRSKDYFDFISQKGKANGFRPIIELDAIPRYLHETNLLNDLLKDYQEIGVCVDLGRLHLQEVIDEHFDSFEYLRKIVDHVTHVHLWNIKVTDKVEHSHYPALPTLEAQDGWADMAKYFSILKESKHKQTILFEHQSNLISDDALDSCYNWIHELTS